MSLSTEDIEMCLDALGSIRLLKIGELADARTAVDRIADHIKSMDKTANKLIEMRAHGTGNVFRKGKENT